MPSTPTIPPYSRHNPSDTPIPLQISHQPPRSASFPQPLQSLLPPPPPSPPIPTPSPPLLLQCVCCKVMFQSEARLGAHIKKEISKDWQGVTRGPHERLFGSAEAQGFSLCSKCGVPFTSKGMTAHARYCNGPRPSRPLDSKVNDLNIPRDADLEAAEGSETVGQRNILPDLADDI